MCTVEMSSIQWAIPKDSMTISFRHIFHSKLMYLKTNPVVSPKLSVGTLQLVPRVTGLEDFFFNALVLMNNNIV